MLIISNPKIAIACFVAASTAAVISAPVLPVAAATVAYVGDTTGQPTWIQPFGSASVPYSVQQFTVSANGLYTFSSIVPTSASPPSGTWVRSLYLYQTIFNPNNSLTNLLGGNSNSNANITSSLTLTAGINYFLVTTGSEFVSNNFGSFNNSISGAGNITLAGATSVPEPITIIGTILGGSVAVRLRRRLMQDRSNG